MIKVICCDVDGTLVTDDKLITEENKYYIKKAVEEKGIKFVIVSGRMPSSLRMFYDQLGIKGLCSSYSGTSLIDQDNNVIVEHRVKRWVTEKAIKVASELGIDLILYDGDSWFVRTEDSYAYERKRAFYCKECNWVSDLKKQCSDLFESNKILCVHPDRNVLDTFMVKMKEEGVLEKRDVYYYPGADFLEIMAWGYNKGTILDDIASYYGISKSEIMALGDDYNDVEMLESAGIGVATANAVDKAKLVSDLVTENDNNHSSVAEAIRKVIFKI